MIHYRFELTGTADDGDLAEVEDIYRKAVKDLKEAGFGVGGGLVAHDTDIDNSAINLPALDVEDKPTKQEKLVRERYAEQKKARRKELKEGDEAAKAEAKRQREARRRTGDRGLAETETGDRGATTVVTGDRGVATAIEASPVTADK